MFLSFQANHSQSIRLCAQLFHFVSFVFGWTGLGLSARPYINMPVPWQLARKLPWKQGQSTVELSAWELKRHLRGQRISWEMPLRFSKAWNLLISVPGGLWVNGGVGIMKMKPKTYWTQIFTLGQGGAWPTRGVMQGGIWLDHWHCTTDFSISSWGVLCPWSCGRMDLFSLQRNGFEEILWSKGFVTQDVDSPSPRLLSIHLRGCISHCCLKDPAHRAEHILGV